jgi:5-methyltetrahydrofolate--homocysteine methyltransferase
MTTTVLQELYDAVLNGKDRAAVEQTRKALDEGIPALEIISQTMVPAMDEVGRLFEAHDYFVPDLLLAGRAMKGGLELLRPLLASNGVEPIGKVVIGTVKGDLHDIGKNIVGSMLEGAGFEMIDLGVDVAPARFIEAIRRSNATIVALSALLTTTIPAMKTTIEAIAAAGLRDQVRIMVGGAPVTRQYAEQIGADGYSDTAVAAVPLARSFVVAEG